MAFVIERWKLFIQRASNLTFISYESEIHNGIDGGQFVKFR